MLGPNKTLLTGVEIEFHGMKYYSFDLPHLKMWKCTLPVGYKSRQWLVFLTPAPVAGLSQDYMWFPQIWLGAADPPVSGCLLLPGRTPLIHGSHRLPLCLQGSCFLSSAD